MHNEHATAQELAEAQGKAGAALALQTSLAMLLMERDALFPGDLLTVVSRAETLLEPFHLSPEAMEFANQTLQGFVGALVKETRPN
ncbi:MAG: hypothetical protein ABSD80_02955 [Caulobacteraceae bacterium]|jgi:hypothetical protein